MKKCWICNTNEANSREHKIKASILKRKFGKKYPNGEMMYLEGSELFELDSYKSRLIKFPPIICEKCNQNITKEHDDAFDIFTKYIENNFSKLSNQSTINYSEIFNSPKIGKTNLYRYVAKHAGCKSVSGDYPCNVDNLRNFILGKDECKTLKVHFQFKEGIKNFSDNIGLDTNNYYNSPVIVYNDKLSSDFIFGGWLSHQWVSIVWIISQNIPKMNQANFDKLSDSLEHRNSYESDSFNKAERVRDVFDVIENSGLETMQKRIHYFDSLIHENNTP